MTFVALMVIPFNIMFNDFKYDSPVVLVSEVSSLELSPVFPVMMSSFLGVNMLKLDVLVLSLEVVNDLGLDKVEVSFNFAGDLNLLERLVRMGV